MDRVNTASIVESCRALPGVSVEDREDGASLRLANPEGRGRMDFYPLFPGLTLARIAVETPSWPAPQPGPCTPEARGPLLINYCLRGRRKLILNDRRHVFLTAGQVSLTERFAQKEYLYPGRLYEGVELFLDPETAEAGVPLLREGFDLDLTALRQRYCPGGETFLADLPLPEELVDRLLRTESAAGRESCPETNNRKSPAGPPAGLSLCLDREAKNGNCRKSWGWNFISYQRIILQQLMVFNIASHSFHYRVNRPISGLIISIRQKIRKNLWHLNSSSSKR